MDGEVDVMEQLVVQGGEEEDALCPLTGDVQSACCQHRQCMPAPVFVTQRLDDDDLTQPEALPALRRIQ